MKRIKKKDPLAVRWFHWINFPVLGIMIWSGLLIYWANDPLPMNQGFPLRLIIPVKYGVKNLKCKGYIYFSDIPPRDYWFERGYVYDAAL